MTVEATIAMRQKQVRRVAEAGATDPSTARVSANGGVRQSPIFKRLFRNGLLVDEGARRCQVDLAAAAPVAVLVMPWIRA